MKFFQTLSKYKSKVIGIDPLKTKSRIREESISLDRVNLKLLTSLQADTIKAIKDMQSYGDFRMIDGLFRTMCYDWNRLNVNLRDIKHLVGKLDIEVIPFSDAKSKPTEYDEKACAFIERAIYAATPNAASTDMGFNELLRALADCYYRGFGLIEINYKTSKIGIVPESYTPVNSKYYGWNMETLGVDELLLFPNGIGMSKGERIYNEKFLICTDKGSIDHPVFSAPLMSLAGFYLASKMSVRWLLQYSQLFGVPFRVVRNSEKNMAKAKETNELIAEGLRTLGTEGFMVCPDKAELDVIANNANANNIPQKLLFDLATEQCDIAIKGQTLTSSTSGVGSRALGEVHAETHHNVVDEVCAFALGIINNQLIPSLIKLNFGASADMDRLPYIGVKHSDIGKDRTKAAYVKDVTSIGVPISKQWVYEELGISAPDKEQELVEPLESAPKDGEPFSKDVVRPDIGKDELYKKREEKRAEEERQVK